MTVPACLVAAALSGESTMTAPDAPTIGAATGGDGQASVPFTPPADDGGALITGYTVTSSPGGFTGTGSSSPIVVTGLSNGTAYTFTVTATNGVGTGSASAASDPVTPTAAKASGGTISTIGLYTVHTFTADGDFTVLTGPLDIEMLLIGAGGGGGSGTGAGGGGSGGGADSELANTPYTMLALANGTYPIVLGIGGIVSSNGGDSTALGLTAVGGGAGGDGTGAQTGGGTLGGGSSGGGGADTIGSGVAGSVVDGISGGRGWSSAQLEPIEDGYGGGGGGGTTAGGGVPGIAPATWIGGAGGDGAPTDPDWGIAAYAGGGAGSGTGGYGVPGTGADGPGGGGDANSPGQDGIAIIRYLT